MATGVKVKMFFLGVAKGMLLQFAGNEGVDAYFFQFRNGLDATTGTNGNTLRSFATEFHSNGMREELD